MPAKQLKGTATVMKNQNNNPAELDQLTAAALSVAEAQLHREGFTIIIYMMACHWQKPHPGRKHWASAVFP